LIAQKEKDRLALFRKKTHAALVIQLAWRRCVESLNYSNITITLLLSRYVRSKRLKEMLRAQMPQQFSLEVYIKFTEPQSVWHLLTKFENWVAYIMVCSRCRSSRYTKKMSILYYAHIFEACKFVNFHNFIFMDPLH